MDGMGIPQRNPHVGANVPLKICASETRTETTLAGCESAVNSAWSYVTIVTALLSTLQGTNISPQNGILKMIFLFPRWDMLVPWRVSIGFPSNSVPWRSSCRKHLPNPKLTSPDQPKQQLSHRSVRPVGFLSEDGFPNPTTLRFGHGEDSAFGPEGWTVRGKSPPSEAFQVSKNGHDNMGVS